MTAAYLLRRIEQIAHKLEHARANAAEDAARYAARPEAIRDVIPGVFSLDQVQRAYATGAFEAIVELAQRELAILVERGAADLAEASAPELGALARRVA